MRTKLCDELQPLVEVLSFGLLVILTEEVGPAPTLRSHELGLIVVGSSVVFDFTFFDQVHPVNWLANPVEYLVFAGVLLLKHVENLLESNGR